MELILDGENVRGMTASPKSIDNITVFSKGHYLEETEKWKDQDGNYRYLFQHDKIVENPLFDDRNQRVEAAIQAKLPKLLRIIADDDLKGFEDLKAEIKAIDQGVKSAKR
jgi:hypothetical protein